MWIYLDNIYTDFLDTELVDIEKILIHNRRCGICYRTTIRMFKFEKYREIFLIDYFADLSFDETFRIV